MRYYKITLSTSTTTKTAFNTITYSSLNSDGSNNPMALQIDLDLFQGLFHQPSQNGMITIYGVPFADLSQASNFTNADITIEVGMSAGLPLANPKQAGIVIQGTVFQSYGNYQGTDVRLNLIIIPYSISPTAEANLSFNWIEGQTLTQAVSSTLGVAFNLPITGKFSDSIVATETQPGIYFTMKSLAQYVNDTSLHAAQPVGYQGAVMSVNSNGITLSDGTAPVKDITAIQFTDIIGNLTWIDAVTIQAKLVMRHDLNVNGYVTFPPGAPTINNATQYNQIRNTISFDGTFQITTVRHVGSSRQPTADSWVTVIDAIISNPTLK